MPAPFTSITSRLVPLDRVNVDTDQIVPKQFLKLIHKTGFGKYLFYDWRFDTNGKPRTDFVLNDAKYAGRSILLARENFGIGSSREHAVWAILDYGFRSVIAPSFADIFYNNCFKNGLLPVVLSKQDIEYLFSNPDQEVEICLQDQIVVAGDRVMHFEIDGSRKKLMLEGLDEIGITLKLEDKISNFEKKMIGQEIKM